MDLSADSALPPARANRLAGLWRALADAAGAERDRWLLWLPVAVGVGITGYFSLLWEPSGWIAVAGVSTALLIMLLGRGGAWPLLLVGCALLAASVGFGAAKLRTALATAPVLESRLGPVAISGTVAAAEAWENGPRVILSQARVQDLAAEATPRLLRVRLLRSETAPSIGQSISLRAVLMPPTPPALPGAYDFGRQAFLQGIGGVGYAVGRVRATNDAPVQNGVLAGFRIWIESLRQGMNQSVMALLPGAGGAMSAALITGDQSAIPADVMQAMRDAGLAHLLAISGFNVALVAGVLFVASRLLFVAWGAASAATPLGAWALRYPVKKWAAVVTIAGILAYTLITGASVPTQRAFLMTAVVLIAMLIDRTAISMRLVMWAALVLMIVAPESLLGASFQMSFAAVIALIAAYESSRPWVRAQRIKGGMVRKAALFLGGMAATTLVAAAATAPFAVYHFNRFALYQLVANFIAVPLTSVWIMPWATLVYFLMPLGLESWALIPMSWGVDALITLAQTVTTWPQAVTVLPSMPVGGLALIAGGGLWLCLWRRAWRFAGLLPIALGCATMFTVRPPDVLIAGGGEIFAVRGGDGQLLFPDGRGGQAFLREVWQRRAGTGAASESDTIGLRCDTLGCIYRAQGKTVAFIRDSAALAEDCAMADVVVSWAPIRAGRCDRPALRIDRRALASGGGHALWLARDGPVRMEAVAETRGDRPWSRKPESRQPENRRVQ